MNDIRSATAALLGAGAMLLQGCAPMTIAYHPRVTTAEQTLRFTQGVGTLAERSADHELFMYPTFRMQGSNGQPTFTIGYANNGAQSQNFSVDNVRAFYRGAPVPLYSYTEKVEEIRQEKVGKQVALAILGVAATAAAANAASRQTYTSNYSGAISNRYGVTRFSGSNIVRVYDPASGIFAGAAVAGATGFGIGQIEYNAQNQELAAEAILQANTVAPQRMVAGQLILKGCCDQYTSANDTIRFEVSANGKVSVFEFLRLTGTAAPPPQVVFASSEVQPTPAVYAPVPAAGPSPGVGVSPPLLAALTPPARELGTPAVEPSAATGRDAYQAERLTAAKACNAQPRAVLTAKGPGYESYSLSCASGDSLAIRCEFGNCRVLK